MDNLNELDVSQREIMLLLTKEDPRQKAFNRSLNKVANDLLLRSGLLFAAVVSIYVYVKVF